MKVFFHDDFYQVYASDPAAAAGRMESIVDVLKGQVEFIPAAPADESDIAAVHAGPHIDRIKSRGVYDIAALAAGGAVQAANLALKEPAFALIRPPGHHASQASAWGFCYFNNMAIAVEHLKRHGRISHAYILDIDFHFGDGTVNILKGRSYVTIHNVVANERGRYLSEVKEEMDECRADMIGISAGFDNHEDDWGGTLRTDDYREIGRLVRAAADRNTGGCFAVLEGGYNHQVLGFNTLSLINGLSGS